MAANTERTTRRDRLPDPPAGSTQINFKEPYETTSLKGQSALVTGGATGIGAGAVVGLAEAGAVVTIADINVEESEKTVAELTSKGHKAQFVKTDVTKWDDLVRAFKSAVAFGGGLDIVIPAAGIAQGGFYGWLSSDKVLDKSADPPPIPKKVLDVNFDHVYYATHLALWYFKQNPTPVDRSKQIIFISSMGGYTSMVGSVDYCTSKWAVRGLFRSLRGLTTALGEGAPKLRVNLIAPTYVATPLIGKMVTYLENLGVTPAQVSDVTDVAMRIAADESVIGRAVAIAPRKNSFDLCDEPSGLDAGREVAAIKTENRFFFDAERAAAGAAAAKAAEGKLLAELSAPEAKPQEAGA